MILTKEQAAAFYRGIEMLDSTGTKWAHLMHDGFPIRRDPTGAITVAHKYGYVADERYSNSTAFAAAYGLLA